MVFLHEEKTDRAIEGTIIDIETIGNFTEYNSDSRRYMKLAPVIFGCINGKSMQIHCAKTSGSLKKLEKIVADELSRLERPFHAFNSDFERGVFFHCLKQEVPFERELNKRKFESKADVVTELRIPQHGDPFKDVGLLCSQAWQKGNINDAISHNRSCLLKERDILLKRGFRIPDPLKLVQK